MSTQNLARRKYLEFMVIFAPVMRLWSRMWTLRRECSSRILIILLTELPLE